MKILKSIAAIIAGVLVTVLISTLVDFALHLVHFWSVPMTDSQALVATLYRIVISIGGAYVTARLAPDRPLWHALLLGYIGTTLGVVGVLATWNKAMGPPWYAIALAVLAIPQCWAGGKLYERQLAGHDATR